jgi:hypothetical protein
MRLHPGGGTVTLFDNDEADDDDSDADDDEDGEDADEAYETSKTKSTKRSTTCRTTSTSRTSRTTTTRGAGSLGSDRRLSQLCSARSRRRSPTALWSLAKDASSLGGAAAENELRDVVAQMRSEVEALRATLKDLRAEVEARAHGSLR